MSRILVLALALLGAAGCERAEPAAPQAPVTCSASLRPSILVEVRDQLGEPAALGAVVVGQTGLRFFGDERLIDSLVAPLYAEGRGGRFDVWVIKPWHRTAVVAGVDVPSGPCGVSQPARVAVTLVRDPNAPAIRQVTMGSGGLGLGCGNSNQLGAHIEADREASHELRWLSRDTLMVVVSPTGVATARCTRRGTTYVIAMAAAAPSVRDSIPVETMR